MCGNTKKRQGRVRKRRIRARPWSYHCDWADWDYYQEPFHSEFSVSEEALANDEAVKKLTEFGENYEAWISREEEDITKLINPMIIKERGLVQTEPLNEKKSFVYNQSIFAEKSLAPPIATNKELSHSKRFMVVGITSGVIVLLMFVVTLMNFSPSISKTYSSPPPI